MLSPTPWKILEGFWLSAPELSGTSSGFCPGTLRHLVCYLHRTFRNLVMHQNPPKPHQLSAPEPSGTLSVICAVCTEPSGTSSCARTLRNLISFLPRNPPEPCRLLSAPNLPEPHQPSVPEPSGTFYTGTLRNLISHLRRKAPEPSGTFSGTWIAPELF